MATPSSRPLIPAFRPPTSCAEACSVVAGVANTFGPAINERAFPDDAESYKTYMGAITLTAPESWGFLAGSTLSGGVINGFNSGANAANGANQTSWYVGGTMNTPLKGLKIGASYDYAGVSDQPQTDDATYANATALYLSYQVTEKMTLFARGEYASSDALNSTATPLLGADKVFAVTGTLQYDLWKNVLSRLEFRWDHAADGNDAYGGTDPGDAPTKLEQLILLALTSPTSSNPQSREGASILTDLCGASASAGRRRPGRFGAPSW